MGQDCFTLDGGKAPLPLGEGFGVREGRASTLPAGRVLDLDPSLPAGEGRMPASPSPPSSVKSLSVTDREASP